MADSRESTGPGGQAIILRMPPADDTDAYFLEGAVEVLRRRFGKLTAGDLITGLEGAVASIRARGGIIRPAQADEDAVGAQARAGQQLAGDFWADEEPGHGYHEAGDYP
jgi:hypothetical protein